MPFQFAPPQILKALPTRQLLGLGGPGGVRGWPHLGCSSSGNHLLICVALSCGFTLLGCLKVNTFGLDYILPFHYILREGCYILKFQFTVLR